MDFIPLRKASLLVRRTIQLLEFLIILVAGMYATALQGTPDTAGSHFSGYTLAAGLMFIILSAGLYRSWRVSPLVSMLWRVTEAWVGTVVILMIWMVTTESGAEELPRAWFLTWVVAAMLLLWLERLMVFLFLVWLRRNGYSQVRVVLLGEGEMVETINQRIKAAAWTGFGVERTLAPKYLSLLAGIVQESQAHEVWVAAPGVDAAFMQQVMDELRYSTVNIRLVPDWLTYRLVNHGMSVVAGVPMLDVSNSPMSGTNLLLKAIEDKVLAAIILILISPFMLLIAGAVKLSSPGPVLFTQRRHGWNGNEIAIYKFRSMKQHSETTQGLTQASRDDPRLTPIGAFLRKTSLDELPQFINVLQGRMSIVGPRPHAIQHNEQYKRLIPRYMLRHKVKPGITGWAQVNGFRGETDTLEKMEKRVEYDLFYIENWSLWFDLKIIVMTLYKGFMGENAY
jgi:putative colanic acid biosynthesis UDP-glucose lipid carrier transferase